MKYCFSHFLVFIIFCFFNSLESWAQPCSANAGPDTSICVGSTATIGAVAAGTGTGTITYSWTPSTNLSCANCPNPVVTAVSNQTYTLTIEDATGCIATDVIQVTADPLPIASFSVNNNNVCANIPVSFSNTSSGIGLSYSWNFGDPASGSANTSTATNPTHTFQAIGSGTQTFNVVLTVTNSSGCSANFLQTVTVNQSPAPALIDPITSFKNCGGGTYDMTVFDGSGAAGSNYTIIWGDGTPNFSSGSFPGSGVQHTYSTSEIFTMLYIVTGTNGCADTALYNVANITNPAIGAANPGATTGCGPLTLCFPLNNYSANHNTTYYVVDYGDGSPKDTLPHPPPATICHTYTTSSCGQPGNAYVFRIKAINLCDSSEASISPIRVYTGPTANFTPAAQNNCVGSTVTFINQTVAGFNSSCSASTMFQWNFGNGQTLTTATLTNPTTVYTAPGTYTVTLTTTNSCGSNTITKTVCIESPPVPDFTVNPASACIPFTATMNDASNLANTCAVTRSWSVIYNGSPCTPATAGFSFVGGTNANSINPQIEFTQAGNYVIRLTLTNSCGSFFIDKPIVAQKPPQVSLVAPASICAGTTTNPSASVVDCLEPSDTYTWSFPGGSPANSNTLVPGTITYPTSGTFPITFSATNACGTTTQTVNFTVNPIPPALNAQVNSPVCQGQTANFTSDANPSTTYSWSGPNGFSATTQNFSLPSVTLTQAGTYTVTGSIAGCPGPASSVNLTVLPIPVISVTPANSTICLGDSVPLTASGASTYSWTPATGLSATNTATVSASPASTQIYTISGSNGSCSGTTTATVNVNPLPVVNAGPDTTVCDQPIAFQLSASPAGGTWSGPNVTAGGQFTPNGIGSFTLTFSFTNANGCTNSDQRVVSVIAPTQPQAGTDTSVCVNSANLVLTPTPTGGIWTGSNVTASGIFSPVTNGLNTLVYEFGTGTCLLRDTMLITVHALPLVTAGSDTTLCIDGVDFPITGLPTGGVWSGTGVINPTGIFSPTTAGAGSQLLTYSYTDANGCSSSDNKNITIHPLPIVDAGPDSTACNQPLPFQLGASPIGGSWSGPNVSSSGMFTPNGTGTFTLIYTFTNVNGCTNSDSRVLTIADPTPVNAGNDSIVCLNAPNIVLNPTPFGGTWTGTNVTPGGVFSATSSGSFELIYSVGSGACMTKDTLEVLVNPLPIVDAGADQTYCLNAGVQNVNGLPAGGTWTGTGITNAIGEFTPNNAGVGTFTAVYTVTDANGCTNSDQIQFTVNPLPLVNAGNDTTLCNQPIPVSLTGSPAGGTWSGPNINAAGVFTPNGTGTSTISYTFTNGFGCVVSDTRDVTVIDPIDPDAGVDFAICIDAPNVNLTPIPAGGVWSGTNVTSLGVFDPTTAGTFELIYSLGAGTCLTKDTLIVTVNPLPVVDAGSNITVCVNDLNTTLMASPAGGTWSGPGIVLPTEFSPINAGVGTHSLVYTFTDGNGCTASDNLSAIVNPLPIVNAGSDTTLCNQPFPVQFTGTPSGGTWSGSGVLANGTFTPNITGTFTLNYTVTNGNGCTTFDTRNVTVIDPVLANAGPDLEACIDAPNVQLNGTPVTGTWSGTNISASGLFDPTTAGTFALVLSNGSGNCLTRDTMLFTVHPLPVVDAGPDDGFCPDDAPVNFSGNPINGIWSGTGITDVNAGIFSPGTAGVGTHTIVYTFTNPITGCVNRDTLLATVHPFPDAQFTYNPIACLGVAETFNNTSTLGNTYNWNFGDGNTSTNMSPSHTYATSGFFDIDLLAISAFGCRDSITQQIEIRVPPIADFTLAPDSACGPLTVNFVDLSSGPSLTYSWNYGNGQTSSSATPSTQIYNAGILADTIYTVTLTLTNFCGTDTHNESVQVMPSPTAIFGTNTNIGCSPLTLDFVNNSVGLPDNFSWDFGDGTTGNQSNATFQHIYTTGTEDTTYIIQLIVSNECGSDTVTHTITVIPNQVNAFFNVDAPSGCVPHTVNFTQFSQGATFSAWDFGDGNGSTTYNTTHTFTQAGTYTVSLFANDGCGFDTTTAVITVFPSPSVDFSSSPDSVCINELFTFTNLSSNVASVTWDFGDGNTSPIFDPQHDYAASGTYQVTLSGVSQTNGCVGSITKPIVVSTNPVAAFTPNPSSGCEDLFVQFTNQSTSTDFVAWDFGDGNFSTATSPSHTYVNPGSYTVKLYVENANGCSDSIEQIITVYPNPVADFTFNIVDPCIQPSIVNFSNNSTGAMNYEWNFGNGTNSLLTNPSTSYATPGTYTVSLIASSIHGCRDTLTETLTIYQQALADFVLPDDSLCAGEPATFISNAQFENSILWDFGNGFSSTSSTVTNEFPSSGTYNVTLIAYGDGGCNDTLTVSTPIVIVPSPTADFSYVNEQAPDPLSGTVNFTNESSGQIWNFWEFGNGDTSSLQDPIYRYNNYGEFLTTLIVGNEYGCTDTAQQLVLVDFFYGLHIPNALAPGHGDFEVANFIPKGVGLKTFELLIYDDWGNLIWSTTALDADGRPTEHWDGTYLGEPVQQDAYVWKCTATFMNEVVWEGKEYNRGVLKRSGTVTVIR